jgi:hypothetical protein
LKILLVWALAVGALIGVAVYDTLRSHTGGKHSPDVPDGAYIIMPGAGTKPSQPPWGVWPSLAWGVSMGSLAAGLLVMGVLAMSGAVREKAEEEAS